MRAAATLQLDPNARELHMKARWAVFVSVTVVGAFLLYLAAVWDIWQRNGGSPERKLFHRAPRALRRDGGGHDR